MRRDVPARFGDAFGDRWRPSFWLGLWPYVLGALVVALVAIVVIVELVWAVAILAVLVLLLALGWYLADGVDV